MKERTPSVKRFANRYGPFVVTGAALALVIGLAPTVAPSQAGSLGIHAPATAPTVAACAKSINLSDTRSCAEKWAGGNNGGATWSGVTSTSVNVVAYNAPDNSLIAELLGGQGPGKLLGTPQEEAHTLEVYTKWFNKNFQTYGRHVNIIPYNSAATLQNGSTAQRADAVAIQKQDHAFLTIGGEIDQSFYTQLTREQIISIAAAQLPARFYKANAPYVYGLMPTTDDQNGFIASFVCNQLGAGSTAFFGGSGSNPPVNGQPRRYGIIYPTTNADGTPSMYASVGTDMVNRLAQCGIHVSLQDEVGYSLDPTTALSQVQAGSTRIIQDKVTTLICLCDPISPTFSASSAATQNYFPEEVETGYLLQDYYQLDQLYNQQEWRHVFGISSLPIAGSDTSSLYYTAYRQIDPNPNDAPNPDDQLEFYELLLAFAGIQGAGPHLTPQTFADAMFSKVRLISNGPGIPSFYYTPTDYGGIKDAQIVWWNPDAKSPDGKKGNFESVGGGYRFTAADWPKTPGQLLFDNPLCTQMGSCGMPSYMPSSTTTSGPSG